MQRSNAQKSFGMYVYMTSNNASTKLKLQQIKLHIEIVNLKPARDTYNYKNTSHVDSVQIKIKLQNRKNTSCTYGTYRLDVQRKNTRRASGTAPGPSSNVPKFLEISILARIIT